MANEPHEMVLLEESDNDDETEPLSSFQGYLDEMKEKMPDNIYLELCNRSKKVFDEKVKKERELLRANQKRPYIVKYYLPCIGKNYRFDNTDAISYNHKEVVVMATDNEKNSFSDGGKVSKTLLRIGNIPENMTVVIKIGNHLAKWSFPLYVESVTLIKTVN